MCGVVFFFFFFRQDEQLLLIPSSCLCFLLLLFLLLVSRILPSWKWLKKKKKEIKEEWAVADGIAVVYTPVTIVLCVC